ncbi:MAG TPA: NADH-quinone oxidoreductase subunit J [Chitinophagaceae bacterium]
MEASAIIFYAIAAFTLTSGLLAVTTTKIFRSAIWLLFSLVGIAALYFWMQVEFIAAVQIIVYVGGIVVLIIFSIFLTQQSGKEMPKASLRRIIFSALASLFGLGFSLNLISEYKFSVPAQALQVQIKDIGRQMLSPTEHGYVLPFEVVSILLLAAMVGCIVIAMKSPSDKRPGETAEPKETGVKTGTVTVINKPEIVKEV